MRKHAIVIDCGSLCTRIGIGGMDKPDDVVQTCRPSNPAERIVAHSEIKNFDGFTELLTHEFEKLKIESAEREFLLSERVNRAIAQRETELEVLFETFKVPYCALVASPTLSMYSEGTIATGVFVDIGEGGTSIQCFYHGLYVKPGSKFTTMGGLTMTKYLQHVIVKRNRQWIDDLNFLRALREQQAYVPMNGIDQKPIVVNLGAGGSLTFSTELAKTGDYLFAPHAFSCGIQSLQDLIVKSIRACEPGMMNELCQNIYLSGGVANMKNLTARLEKELNKLLPETPCKVKKMKMEDLAVWFGGGVLACVEMFRSVGAERVAYGEEGKSHIARTMGMMNA